MSFAPVHHSHTKAKPMHAYGPFTFLLKVSGVLSKHFGELTTGLEEASFFKALEARKMGKSFWYLTLQ